MAGEKLIETMCKKAHTANGLWGHEIETGGEGKDMNRATGGSADRVKSRTHGEVVFLIPNGGRETGVDTAQGARALRAVDTAVGTSVNGTVTRCRVKTKKGNLVRAREGRERESITKGRLI